MILLKGRKGTYHSWFAWFPVMAMDRENKCFHLVWLQRVGRNRDYFGKWAYTYE